MKLDKKLEFCDALSVVGGIGGPTIITDCGVIDLGNTTNYPGEGNDVYLCIQVAQQVLTGGTAGTITFTLVSDANQLTLNDAPTVHLTSIAMLTDDTTAIATAIAAGTLTALPNATPNMTVAGQGEVPYSPPPVLLAALPGGAYQRYLGIKTTIATAATTQGKINAFLLYDKAPQWRAHPNAI